jgi:hypothetical protein
LAVEAGIKMEDFAQPLTATPSKDGKISTRNPPESQRRVENRFNTIKSDKSNRLNTTTDYMDWYGAKRKIVCRRFQWDRLQPVCL